MDSRDGYASFITGEADTKDKRQKPPPFFLIRHEHAFSVLKKSFQYHYLLRQHLYIARSHNEIINPCRIIFDIDP